MNVKTLWLMSALFLCAGIIHSQDDVDNANKTIQYIKNTQNLNREMTQRRIASARTLATSPDGNLIVTASDDNTATICDSKSGHGLLTFVGHEKTVGAAAFSPDGTRIATASNDGTAMIWDIRTGNRLMTFFGPRGSGVHTVAFSPVGSLLVTASDRALRLWDTRTGELRRSFHVPSFLPFSSATFSPNGACVIGKGGASGNTIFWRTSGERTTSELCSL